MPLTTANDMIDRKNGLFSRLYRTIRNIPDPRLVREITRLSMSLNQLSVQRDAEVQQLAKQREDLTLQRADLLTAMATITEQRDQLLAERKGLNANLDRMAEALGASARGQLRASGKAGNAVNIARRADLPASVGPAAVAAAAIDALRTRHLDLVEATLIGAISEDAPLPVHGDTTYDSARRNRGLDWPQKAFSMIGAARMSNLRTLMEHVLLNDIPGDFIETGVWRGGASILMRAVLAAYGIENRKVIVADSFEGLPPPNSEKFPADAGATFHEYDDLAVTEEQVRRNFAKFGLLDDQVIFLKGWFRDTMPRVASERIALLRLDGDMYESTIDPLVHLYDKIPPGGWVIVDDYEVVPACNAAVQDFFAARKISPVLQPIDGVGVYFQKTL